MDGLVANVAKYLDAAGGDRRRPGTVATPASWSAIAPARSVRSAPAAENRQRLRTRQLTMVCATLDDGQELLGLNEIYFGHPRPPVVALHRLHIGWSAGAAFLVRRAVVSTGTGATGWCGSIARQRADAPALADTGRTRVVLVRPRSPALAGHRCLLTSGRIGPDDYTWNSPSEGELGWSSPTAWRK